MGLYQAYEVVLEVTDGPHRGQFFSFREPASLLAGRAADAQLWLGEDPQFSRNHIRFEIDPPLCYLTDLGSRSGTFVNNMPIKDAYLRHGDVISGGQTRIRCSIYQLTADGVPGPAVCEPLPAPEPVLATPIVHSAHAPLIPGYRILEELGRGGTSIIFRAEREATREPCALKVVTPARRSSEQVRQRFLREAQLLSSLNHPRIVRFLETGAHDDRLFIAMEYVENEPFEKIVRDRSAATGSVIACGICCRILEALAYAHKRGLVHRDVKPANVLLFRRGNLHVKLTDFGLAKSFGDAGLSGITMPGEFCGSLAFTPPEQVRDSRSAQPAGDLYAAGATLYAYLSGQLPFDFAPGGGAFRQVLEDEPVPLGSRCPDLPVGLVAAVHRALAKAPEDRFKSAEEMRQAILPFTGRR